MSADPHSSDATPQGGDEIEAPRDAAVRCIRERRYAEAIALLDRALALRPGDPHLSFDLGVALQGARRHQEALKCFAVARDAAPADAGPHLHAAWSWLALGQAEDALHAALAACRRAPQAPQALFAAGRAFLGLDRFDEAEARLTAALRHAPEWADAWHHRGLARERRGDAARAESDFRQALRIAPDHAGARARLAAATKPMLSLWKPADPAAALGHAVGYLRTKPAFAMLPFAEWTTVLQYQVARGHYFFAVDQDKAIRGFAGWALAGESLAEGWVEGRAGLTSLDCVSGDCVIMNAWAADSGSVNRFLIESGRPLLSGKRTMYFKRRYPDGRTRAVRMPIGASVERHLVRAASLASVGDGDENGQDDRTPISASANQAI